jgi:hypothetical protein
MGVPGPPAPSPPRPPPFDFSEIDTRQEPAVPETPPGLTPPFNYRKRQALVACVILAVFTALGVIRATQSSPEIAPIAAVARGDLPQAETVLPEVPDGVWWKILEDFYKPVAFDPWPARHFVTVKLNDRVTKATLRAISLRIKSFEKGPCKETHLSFYVPDSQGGGYWAQALFNPDLKVWIDGFTIEEEKHDRTAPVLLPVGSTLLGCWMAESGTGKTSIAISERGGRFFRDLSGTGSPGFHWVEFDELPWNEGRVFRQRASVNRYVVLPSGYLKLYVSDGKLLYNLPPVNKRVKFAPAPELAPKGES